jgi:hypothetical protein
MNSAKSGRSNQISMKQLKAKIHNELVSSRNNVLTLTNEKQRSSALN